MNSFGRIVDIIVLIIMTFIIPILYMAQKEDYVLETAITTQTAFFTDTIRNNGYIDEEGYNAFYDWLIKSNNLYDIEISHYKKVVIEDENNGYIMDYEYVSNDEIIKQITKNEKYEMKIGDFISVNVVGKDNTFGTKIFNMLTGIDTTNKISVSYGGVIRDENY